MLLGGYKLVLIMIKILYDVCLVERFRKSLKFWVIEYWIRKKVVLVGIGSGFWWGRL